MKPTIFITLSAGRYRFNCKTVGNNWRGQSMGGRDVITTKDVVQLRETLAVAASQRITMHPPGGRPLGSLRAADTLPEVPPPDSWNQRLLKFIPGEAIGLYLALDRAVHSVSWLQGDARTSKLAIWLAVVLTVAALFNVLYLRLVWRVRRGSQIAASTAALIAYAYATGGVFETMGWADPSVQMIVVILVATFLIFFKPPEKIDVAIGAE